MNQYIENYNNKLSASEQEVCNLLAKEVDSFLKDAESKIWHAHPVWFLAGNPIVGYGKQKNCIRLMFWSGASFNEEKLSAGTGKFKDASMRCTCAKEVNKIDLRRWLEKSRKIQWDYKNLVKRKGKLERLS